MILLEYFNNCNKGPWTTIGDDTQYKVQDGILYFQPSKSKADWKNNLIFPAVPYSDMDHKFLVHAGFLNVWKKIRHTIEKLEFSRIVGYSHGAALALFAHEDFLFRNEFQPVTYVFGCPRVFFLPDAKTRARFSSVINIQSKGDLVTMVPPGYSHVGNIIKLDGKVKQNGESLAGFLTRHTPNVYRQRLVDAKI